MEENITQQTKFEKDINEIKKQTLLQRLKESKYGKFMSWVLVIALFLFGILCVVLSVILANMMWIDGWFKLAEGMFPYLAFILGSVGATGLATKIFNSIKENKSSKNEIFKKDGEIPTP